MFEEDFERCFICQVPCKGLYCSAECRLQDKGTASPSLRTSLAPVRLTAQLPPTLSPLARPQITPSPRMPAHVPSNPNGDSSSASSMSSSPLQSPQTNPSASDSPHKDAFNLPPPAYPNQQSLNFAGSMPVKIPPLAQRPLPATQNPSGTPQSHSHSNHLLSQATSIDTLRFGRKPGVINSVTSPNALLPRCACGKPANHRSRTASRDRAMESGFSILSLGPSATQPDVPTRPSRVPSDASVRPVLPLPTPKASTGLSTPNNAALHTVSSTMGGSLLSRSRSDPIPSSPPRGIAPLTDREPSNIAPASRRASHNNPSQQPFALHNPVPTHLATSPRRGRSRERQTHPTTTGMHGLEIPTDREEAPSRSRHRREERRKASPLPPSPQVAPSWSLADGERAKNGEGIVAPLMRRNGSGGSGQRSPVKSRGQTTAEDEERKRSELRRASKQLGQVFGVAAG